MATFTASLKTPGDMKGLPATLRVDNGTLHIAAGDTSIGEWPRDEIVLEPFAGGFRLKVEGEMLLLEMKETDAFEAELMPPSRTKKTRKQKARHTKEAAPPKARASKEPKPKEDKPSRLSRVLAWAEKRWGSLLPSWLFTKGVAYSALAFLAATVFFPEVVSVVILVAGLAVVLIGAVAFSDSVLASRWLPGRARPEHALIAGVAILLVGVLLQVVARL